MAWINNDDKIAILYQKWAKFGWLVSEPTYEGEVDLEELIAETTWAARYSFQPLSCCFWCCRQYAKKYYWNR